MTELLYLEDVVTLDLNPEKCTGCGMCAIVCPHAVFEIVDRKSVIRYKNRCMECGACARNCPDEAISVKSGVGCAAGIINGILRGTEPTCDCGSGSNCC
jgi:NAD-dependent dihydropyrimidine dehydrogenase PreA subunit